MSKRSVAMIGSGGLAIIALGFALQRSQTQIRFSNQELQNARGQVALLETRIAQLTNQVASTTKAERLGADQLSELMRLRSEATDLRRQTNELARAFAQSQRDLAVAASQNPAAKRAEPGIPATPENSPIPSSTLPPRAPDPPMLQAAYDQGRLGQLSALKAVLDEHPDFLNQPVGVRGSTLLHTAAYNGHLDVVKELLGRGATVNQRNFVGESALYSAVLRGTPDVIRLLIASGADPSIPDNNGLTPLKLATDRNRAEIITLLRQAGAHE
jgi:ankyrin repeat protein